MPLQLLPSSRDPPRMQLGRPWCVPALRQLPQHLRTFLAEPVGALERGHPSFCGGCACSWSYFPLLLLQNLENFTKQGSENLSDRNHLGKSLFWPYFGQLPIPEIVIIIIANR